MAYAFATLEQVAQPSTRWSIVYELDTRRLHFRTHRVGEIRSLRIEALDFDCPAGARYIDLDAPLEGDVSDRLAAQSLADNRELIRRSYRGTGFLSGVPESEITRVAQFGFSAVCTP